MSQTHKRFTRKDSPMLSLLEDLGIDFKRKDHTHYKFRNQPFMDLVVETWIEKDSMIISVCHYGEQNGDAMRDPDMVYRLNSDSTIEQVLSYRNDYTGLEQHVYQEINGQLFINPSLMYQLKKFSRQWSRNLINQGFTKETLLK